MYANTLLYSAKIQSMKQTTIHDCRIIDLRKISVPRGNLTPIESGVDVPFDIKRIYYLYDVPGGESRGYHAYKQLYDEFLKYRKIK